MRPSVPPAPAHPPLRPDNIGPSRGSWPLLSPLVLVRGSSEPHLSSSRACSCPPSVAPLVRHCEPPLPRQPTYVARAAAARRCLAAGRRSPRHRRRRRPSLSPPLLAPYSALGAPGPSSPCAAISPLPPLPWGRNTESEIRAGGSCEEQKKSLSINPFASPSFPFCVPVPTFNPPSTRSSTRTA